MKGKILTTILLIIILISMLAVNSYASTDYSVYNKETNMYYLKLSFKKLIDLDIPDLKSSSEYSSSDIYFILFETERKGTYSLYISSSPFVVVSYDYYKQPFVNTVDRTSFVYIKYNSSTSSWENETNTTTKFSMANNYKYLIFSDDIVDESTGEVVYTKTNFYSPLVKTVRSINAMNTVTSEIVSILPVTLTIVVGLIGIRKAIAFTRNKLRNA